MVTATQCVVISGREFCFQRPWDGRQLALAPVCPYLAFDTETEIVDLNVEIPRLALASASNGTDHVLLHPDQIADFIDLHTDARFICHNATFDFWVVDRHLREFGAEDVRRRWWVACRENRLHDSMILDQLIRLAEGRTERVKDKDTVLPRDLATVCAEYSFLRISKDDPHRGRYGEIIRKDWADVDEEFFVYAIKDAIATYRAYLGMRDRAEQLMREHGYDPDLNPAEPHAIRPDSVKTFGLLTEAVQVKGAIALAAITRNGMRLEASRLAKLKQEYRRKLDDIIKRFLGDYPGVIKQGRDGAVTLSRKTEAPAVSEKAVRGHLEQAVKEIKAKASITIEVPRTEKTGVVSTAAKLWKQYVDQHPFIKLWVEREKTAKLCEFFGNLSSVVHPRYTPLLRTGRTSCKKPNVQQVPREGGFRELFVPTPGHFLVAVDYTYAELRTLAAICESRFGESKLAQTIRAGIDPHCHTAALILGKTLSDFEALKEREDEVDIDGAVRTIKGHLFKKHRNNAKAINFGVPGGLGPATLVAYAESTFGVSLSMEQAAQMRGKLITEIYPELNEKDGYLAEDEMARLAKSLDSSASACWLSLDWKETRDKGIVRAVQNLVRGNTVKRDGGAYSKTYVDSVWNKLNKLNRNGDPRLVELLKRRQGCKELERLLFPTAVVTLTGRVRGDVTYTQARNTPFQGLAADGAKLALWRLVDEGYRVVGFVHDELLIEVPDEGGYVYEETVTRIRHVVNEEMEAVLGPRVPAECEASVSTCWSKSAKLLVKDGKVYPWTPDAGGSGCTKTEPALRHEMAPVDCTRCLGDGFVEGLTGPDTCSTCGGTGRDRS